MDAKKLANRKVTRQIARDVRLILVARFPKCFMPKGAEKLPLAIGTGGQIQKLLSDLSWSHLQLALVDYTHGPTYLRGIVAGAPRYDLEGNPNGEVLPSEADYAASLLANMTLPKAKPSDASASDQRAA